MQLVVGGSSRVITQSNNRTFLASNLLIKKNAEWINRHARIIFASYSRAMNENQQLLVELAKYLVGSVNTQIVFLSSDHAFNGAKGRYSVYEKPDPDTEYGLCKVELEKIFQKHTVVRFTTTGPSQNEKPLMDEMARSRQINTVYENHYFSPISTIKINHFLSQPKISQGIYHIAGDRLSKAAYLRQIGINTSSIPNKDITFKDHSLLSGFK